MFVAALLFFCTPSFAEMKLGHPKSLHIRQYTEVPYHRRCLTMLLTHPVQLSPVPLHHPNTDVCQDNDRLLL